MEPAHTLPALLIAASELRAALASYTVLDVRYRLLGPPAETDYREGHIPDASFVDLDRDLADPPGAHGRHPLPDSERFGAAMRRVGVCASRPVVCYDFADGTSAARAWWLLRYFGHRDVRILDGGYAAWLTIDGTVSRGEPDGTPGDFSAEPGSAPLLDAGAAANIAATGVLLDARSAERYRGDREPIDPVAGHIPGAVSAPTLENVDTTGRFLPVDRLRERFAGLGVTDGIPVGTYCGSGVTAAHEVLALELAGIRGAALYVDSWSGWVTDPIRPVATSRPPHR